MDKRRYNCDQNAELGQFGFVMKMKFQKKYLESLRNGIVWRSSQVLEKQDRKKALLVFFAYAVMGIFDVIGVMFVGVVGSLTVSGVAANKPGNRVNALLEILSIEDKSLQFQVALLGFLSAVFLIIKSITSWYLSRRILLFLSRRSAQISQRLISQLLNQDVVSIREKTVQEIIYALTNGVNTVVVGIFGAILILASDILLLGLFGFTLFAIDLVVAVTSVSFFSALGFFLYRNMHRKASELGETVTKLTIQSGNKIAEVVNCYRELVVRDRRNFYAQKIGEMRLSSSDALAKLTLMSMVSKYILEISMVVGGLFVGAFQFMTQPATRAVAVIAVFLVASARIVPGVLRVQMGIVGIKAAIATAKPTIDLIENYLQIEGSAVANPIEPYKGRSMHSGFNAVVSIKKLTFRYQGSGESAINEVSLDINEGEFIGIVGPSGSGKSTLVDLILGVLNAPEGTVLISGLHPREAIKRWPGAISYVPQEANFVDGTVKENICLGYSAEEVLDQEIIPILEAAQLAEILSLPRGINSEIGERGNKLSGGQRQRLGIARALFTWPKLLILDESTSSLDANTEARLTEYLDSLKGKMTLIVVAHRLSTLRNADQIVYLDKGLIRGTGSFETLRGMLPEFDSQANAMGIERK